MESRLRIALVAVLALFLTVGLRLFQLQVVQGARYYRLAEQNHIRRLVTPAPRGKILDRNGELLADSRPSFSILLVPAEADTQTVQLLARILALPDTAIWNRLGAAESGLTPVRLRRDADLALVSQVEENSSSMPGVIVKTEPRRYYAFGDVFAHVLGYVNEIPEDALARDTSYRPGNAIGVAGLEAKYEQVLRSHDGSKYAIVNVWGKEVGTLPERVEAQPVPGQELHVTLDAELQKRAAKLMEPYSRGVVVGLSLKDGGVLCMLSKPGFDPNLLSGSMSGEDWQALLADKATPFVNRAVMSVYNPGSCMKPLTALAAMKLGVLNEHSTFQPCTGVFVYGHQKFKCTEVHGRLELEPAIIKSCNIYFYQVGLKTGIDALAVNMKEYGFGAPTGIDLPGERNGIVPSRDWLDKRYGANGWSIGIVLNLAIGQGEVQATPLQLAQFYAMLAGDGAYYVPHLLDFTKDSEGRIERYTPVKCQVAFDPQQLRIIREALVGVVREGTGVGAQVPGITIGGKTGTAEHTGGDDHAWFVCYAGKPLPEVVFCVLVENGGKGGMVAAPIARELIKQYYGIKDEVPVKDTLAAGDSGPAPKPAKSAKPKAKAKSKTGKRKSG
jgi:penicillin-binding protein 2